MATLAVVASNAAEIYKTDAVSYANAHDAANAEHAGNDDWWFTVGQFYDVGPKWAVYRAGLVFSLASLPVGSIVTAATISLNGGGDESDTDFDIVIVSGADLADTFVVADYGELLDEITSFGLLTTVGLLIDDWNVINLSAVAIAAIEAAAGGTIRFGVRSSRDISNTTPKLNGGSALEYVGIYGSDEADKEPKLTITYTVPVAPTVTTDPATEVT